MAANNFIRLYLVQRRPLTLAIVVALILLAEAMITVVFSRDWHLSWWEWHVLMAVAFGIVAWGARVEYRRERSLTGAFGGLYLSSTLERLVQLGDTARGEALPKLRERQARTRRRVATGRPRSDSRFLSVGSRLQILALSAWIYEAAPNQAGYLVKSCTRCTN